MYDCSQGGITDTAFVHLRGVHALDMCFCSQDGITDAAFVHLEGIHSLRMCSCSPVCLAAAYALGLAVVII
jgi:hypothetical protein